MKQIRRRAVSQLYTLPFLIFLFILLTVASYVLATSGISVIFSADSFISSRGIVLLTLLPLGLLVFLGVFFFLHVSETTRRGDSSRFGNRVFLVLCLIVFASSFSQTVIVSRYVSSAVSSWFDLSFTQSLKESERIAVLYYDSRIRLMSRIADRFLTGLSISNYRSRPIDWMNEMRSIDTDAGACQVYLDTEKAVSAAEWTPVVETGDSIHFVPRDRMDMVRDGLFSIDDSNTVLRYGRIVHYSSNRYICVYTSVLPSGFLNSIEDVRKGQKSASVIEALRPFIPFIGIWLFLLFVLPSLLLLVSICWYVSRRLADPARAVMEAADRLAVGDTSWRIVSHNRDEFASSAARLNNLAESLVSHRTKKGDKKAVLQL